MLEKLELHYVGPATKMELSFAPRLNLLTGDNGLGKSFILDCAWWTLSRTWAGEPAWPQPDHRKQAHVRYVLRHGSRQSRPFAQQDWFDVESWAWRVGARWGSGDPDYFTPRRRPNPGLVLYARIDGGFGVWDPARNVWRKKDLIGGADAPRSYRFMPEQLWEGLTDDAGRALCNGLLRDWVSWQQRHAPEFTTLCSLLDLLSPGDDERLRPGPPTRVSPRDARDIPTLDLPYGNVPLTHASAGVRRILSLAYLLVWSWHEHVRAAQLREEPPTRRIVLLVDELEAHLHPRWQRLMLPALLQVAAMLRRDVDVQIIAATHAPLVLASVEPEFDPRQDALFTLDLVRANGGAASVVVTKADWRPRGDANAWLVSDVFDLKTARSVPAEKALEKATKALRQPNLPVAEVRRIHRELHRVLKDTDPFWPRWEARAKAAGIKP